jgi:hypothetical protein
MSATTQILYTSVPYETDVEIEAGESTYFNVLYRTSGLDQTLTLGGITNGPSTTTDGSFPITAAGPKSRRRYGVQARFVTISRTAGSGEGTQFKIRRKVVIFTQDFFTALREAKVSGTEIDYEGQTDWKIISLTAEKQN